MLYYALTSRVANPRPLAGKLNALGAQGSKFLFSMDLGPTSGEKLVGCFFKSERPHGCWLSLPALPSWMVQFSHSKISFEILVLITLLYGSIMHLLGS
jgi:hypothetical protein